MAPSVLLVRPTCRHCGLGAAVIAAAAEWVAEQREHGVPDLAMAVE